MSDAWRYATHLSDPEVTKQLLQATLSAYHTVKFAREKANPSDFGTEAGWVTLQDELHKALAAAGHPAGEA